MRNTKKLKRYKPTAFKAKDSHYDKAAADFAVAFIENLCHTKGTWAGKPFLLLDWQEQIIRDLFGILNYRHEALEIIGRLVNHDGGHAGEPAGAAG